MVFGWYILKVRGEDAAGVMGPLHAMYTWLRMAGDLVETWPTLSRLSF